MICKMAIIAEQHTLNSLEYAERGGELLSSNFVDGCPKEIFKDFKLIQDLNDRAKNKSIHTIISLNPKDDLAKLTTQDLIDISDQYLLKHGFDNNQSATYIHREKEHLHLHIIANRINFEGKCTSSSHNYAKNVEFSKEMEVKYQLISTNRKVKGVDFVKDNARAEIIRNKIHQALLKSKTIDQFCLEMKNKQVLVLIGRGISFVDSSGAKFKGSDLGREYSLMGIEKMLKNNISQSHVFESSTIKEETPPIEKEKQTSTLFVPPILKQFKSEDDDETDSRYKKRKRGLGR